MPLGKATGLCSIGSDIMISDSDIRYPVRDIIRLFDIKSSDIAIYSVEVNDVRRDEVESDIICRGRINPISNDFKSNNSTCVVVL